ncbi:MAG: hypothetical protein U5N56_10095 [Candidatus Marinimicrobia bacterium]|nr:hypothetical protein [Candidatus Neomarinimicrobiota bacterium]
MPVAYEWKKLLLMLILTITGFMVYVNYQIESPGTKLFIILFYMAAVLPFIYPRRRKNNVR